MFSGGCLFGLWFQGNMWILGSNGDVFVFIFLQLRVGVLDGDDCLLEVCIEEMCIIINQFVVDIELILIVVVV